MPKDLVIIGNGSFAKLLHYYLTEYSEYNVKAFSVNSKYLPEMNDSSGGGVSIVSFEDLETYYPPNEVEIILGIGYSQMNDVRKKMFFACKEKGYDIASFVHPTAVVSKDIVLGEGNIILENTVIQPFVEIGAGNLFWHNVKIAHDDKIGSFNTFAQNTSVAGVVNVGNNCFLGNSSIILNRKNIADYTLVGAGAICKADTNPYDVIVPAKGVVLENRKSIDYI